ncbi:MAG: hypothetical protein BGO49_13140 [Planctomycetales bacterium 71-10]|nr:MAG: hypothetical protein BGO49_13140 [Planctomycetales bacterium 71-10]
MGRSPSDNRRSLLRRARPIMEGLEERRVMSADPLGAMSTGANVDPMTTAKVDLPATTAEEAPTLYAATAAGVRAASPSASRATPAVQSGGGTFAKNYQQFSYTTPRGARVVLSIQGRGSLEGTYVDSSGALNLRYGLSNSYTKIVANVQGGNGRADLASVFSLTQAEAGAQNSVSGVGSPVIGMINLRQFDLIPGGTINAEAGIGVLGLRSAAAGSQIQLRELTGLEDASQRYDARGNSPTYNASLANIIATDTSTSSSSSSSSTSGNTVITDVFLVQTLAGGDGEFLSAGNIVLQSTNGDPGLPPPPPGVVITIDKIDGDLATVPDLQTDPRIFGYDPTTGRVLRFQLDLNDGEGAVDGTFAPISVPGSPADVGLSLGRDGGRLVLLVNTGSAISAYDATYGTALGSFTVPAGFYATGSTDAYTVIGDPDANQLQQVDVTASLAAGTAVAPAGNPSPYTPPAGLSLLGGITGIPGSNNIYTSVAATFNSLQPLENQLGYLNVAVTGTQADPSGGQDLVNRFSTVQQRAFTPYVPIPSGNPDDVATSVGSVDRSFAVNTGTANGASAPNTIRLYSQVTQTSRGSIVLDYPNQLSDLSESFRPDLAGSVLIDVQGTIQSIRGSTADGMVLNDSGLLNLISFQSVTNSTIVGQPVGHVRINRRDNVSILSTERPYAGRGGVTYVPGLEQIGPLSQTRNRPQA